ncbi:rod shape-determining protein MreC [candidate division WOR-1 bacterium RIFCSPLOWO2_02_FULL_46_20]|uniref:Cell shape-determining protein MreC n=2 Tax=Saganbacteria TaxID=1703751 RepID=A0A1F4RDM0_UNCSA|nr:MAG: rod shape-determining protein MreC [candidate division WOR-1 bacterium RIFCSPLOWO2_02_FULL_46_20]
MSAFRPYRKKKSYALAITIVLLAVVVSFSSFRDLFGVRSVLQSVIYPFQFVVVSVWKGVGNIPVSIINLRNLSQENAALKSELVSIKPNLAVLNDLQKENERLSRALSFKQDNQHRYNLLPARIIGRSPAHWFSILEINKGSLSGVKNDMPVIYQTGLVGRVIEVAVFSAKVLLIIDAGSEVAAADVRSRDLGVIEGTNFNKLIMKYVSSGGDVQAGDQIVTSNISTIFQPGLPIGTVLRATKGEHDLFYQIEIKPAVDFSKIEEVFVIL